ncbi:MAG TPA: IS630 family transposase [Polyangiales bacterium]|nr:IS630 family transposase [Polyangiales bacterium]
MNVRYVVTLNPEERGELEALVSGGTKLVRVAKRAQILLAAAEGETDERISKLVRVGTSTVYRIKRRCVEEGLEEALHDRPRPGGPRKLNVKQEALLIATACSQPQSGRARWTMQLLADEMVRLTEHSKISRETVRRRLAENQLKPWQQKMWCVPKVDAEYVARMEDVLDLYSAVPDRKRPVVSFDESPVQLIGEFREPIPAAPGRAARIDYEYRRNGTANLFVFLDVHRPWRHVKVTDRRAATDFAECMRDLVDVHYPKAERIRVVLDNLATHTPSALYRSFPAEEARRILRRLELHYVPKHASWLNMVEIEIGVLKGQCLSRRIADQTTLASEITSWQRARNQSGARIAWLFTVERARRKMARAYPRPTQAKPQPLAA